MLDPDTVLILIIIMIIVLLFFTFDLYSSIIKLLHIDTSPKINSKLLKKN